MTKLNLLLQRVSGLLHVLDGMAKIAPQLDVVRRPAAAAIPQDHDATGAAARPNHRRTIWMIGAAVLLLFYYVSALRTDSVRILDDDHEN